MKAPSDVCVLVAQHGIGDHYIVAGFAEAVAKRHRLNVWVAGRRELSFVAPMFPSVACYLHWPDHMNAETILTGQPIGGCYYFAHFPRMDLARAVGFKDFHFLDAYRVRLRVQAGEELTGVRHAA